jgi:hypothetical protein
MIVPERRFPPPWTFDELDALQRKNGPVTFARAA